MFLLDEKFVTVCLVRAPIAQVLNSCIAAERVQSGGAVLTPHVTEPPNRHFENQDRKADWFDCSAGYLVSTPKDNPGLTVIECPMFEALSRSEHLATVLRMLHPDIEIMTVVSDIENKSNQTHGFELWFQGQCIRHAAAKRRNGRWKWDEGGIVQPFENGDAYLDPDIAKRLGRDRLGQYMSTFGLDVTQHLVVRDFETAMLITSGVVMQSGDTRPRTTRGQAPYEKLLESGFGQPEYTEDLHEGQRKRFRQMSDEASLSNKANRAFNRLLNKDHPSLADVVKIYKKFETDWLDRLGPARDPSQTLRRASSLADQLDHTHPDSMHLRDKLARWTKINGFMMNLYKDCPDTWGYGWSWEQDMVRIIQEVIDTDTGGPADQMALIKARFALFQLAE